MTATLRSTRLRTAGLGWLVLTALAIAVFAPLPYLTDTLSGASASESGQVAGNYAARSAWVQVVFYAHVLFAGLALLLSPVQLSSRIRARVPVVHRTVGRVVLPCILLGGTAGLVIAPLSLAGLIGTTGFGALALLWITFAVAGFRAIRRGDVVHHRRWMLRAFAMTYAAVTLRLWLVALIPLFDGDFLTAYLFVPFLCWVPNLIVVELILRRDGNLASPAPPSAGLRPAA